MTGLGPLDESHSARIVAYWLALERLRMIDSAKTIVFEGLSQFHSHVRCGKCRVY